MFTTHSMATPQNSRPDGKSSIEAATEAIAKVNAMLIAKGKLKPSQLNSHPGAKKSGPQSYQMTMEVEINDVPIGCRNMLTRGSTQEEISKMSGAAVATRGRYMTPEERANNPSERALYLSVQATAKEAVDLAVGRINEIITNGIARQGAKMSKFSPAGIRGPALPPPRGLQPGFLQEPAPPMGPPQGPPQPGMVMPGVQNIVLFQEKLVIGLEHAPPNFSVKDKVFGPAGTFLQHIQAETGCKVTLRGRGSGFIESNGTEAMEPMHIHLQHVTNDGLLQAKNLSTNLIQTVQQEYAAFQQSFVSVPPPNMLPQSPYMIPPPQLVSIAKPPPLLPGQPIVSMSMAPPAPILQPPPQNTFLTPPPAPGQMIQTQPLQTFAPPSSLGQPIPQYVQASEQQILSVPVSQPPPMMVSPSSNQQPTQMVITSMGGQPPLQTSNVQQVMQQQLVPPGSYPIQQPQQPAPVAQHQQILQQPAGIQQTGIQIQQQTGLQQQIGLQQPALHQQTVLQQQPTMTAQQPIYQQPQQQVTSQFTPALQSGLQQLPTSMQSTIQHLPPGIQQIQQQLPPVQQVQQATIQQQQQQQYPAAGIQTAPPGPWGQPPSSYQQVYAVSQQQVVQSQAFQQPPQSQQSMIMTSAQPQPSVSTTPSCSAPVWSTPTSYVYTSGPKEEPKRRFTEIKQEDKVPDNLLGYEHGPPHLANLVVQPGLPAQQPMQQLSPGSGGQMVQVQDANAQGQGQQFEPSQPPPAGFNGQVLPSQINVAQSPQAEQQQRLEMEERVQGGQISLSPGPQPGFGQQQTNGDKSLMPPPPPPTVTGAKRQSPSPSPQPGPDRKKVKGFQDEEEEGDVPSSLANQVKEFKKYSYNQYSGNAQLYQNQEPNSQQNFEVNANAQNYDQVNVQQQQQQQAQSMGLQDPNSAGTGIQSSPVHMIPGTQSPGVPPPPGGDPGMMPGYQPENHGQFLQYQAHSQPPVQQASSQVYIVSSQPPQSGYVQSSMAQSYNAPHPLQSSPSFMSSPQQQQQMQNAPFTMPPSYLQPPPPPPVMEESRTGPPHDIHSGKEMMDGRGVSGFNPSYLQFNRDIKNSVQQPPPPPPPPRSYW